MTANAQPAPMTGVTPNLSISPATEVVEFYKVAFGAEELNRMASEDGKKLMHAWLRINGGSLIVNDAFPEYGHPMQTPQAFVLHLQVDDVDAWWTRALAAGATVSMPLEKQFWGDRYGQLKDPYGVTWSLGQAGG